MPLIGGPGVAATARTPEVGDLDQLARSIAEMQDVASGRGVTLDVLYPYHDPGIMAAPDNDADRHREAFAHLEQIGVTWIMVAGSTRTPEATREFLQTFGATYLAG